jgi:dTDP-4-dehydrorhamnose 3,5-epimerase
MNRSNYVGTLLEGVELFTFTTYKDERGYFSETFNQHEFNDTTKHYSNFIQDNESYSIKNVIRGLHYQSGIYAQSKLVRCFAGIINDVIVDVRKGSSSYGEHMIVKLGANDKILYIPKGYAHGFAVLSDYAIVQYKVDNFYNKEYETGVRFNDENLNINWGISIKDAIVSEKDRNLPLLEL